MTSWRLFVHISFVDMSVSDPVFDKMPDFFRCFDLWPSQAIHIEPFLSVFFNLKNRGGSIKQIYDLFVVDLKIGTMNCVHVVNLLLISVHLLQLVKQILKSSRHYASIFQLFRTQFCNVFIVNRPLNCVRLPATRLPIGKYGPIIPIKTWIDNWQGGILENRILSFLLWSYMVKLKWISLRILILMTHLDLALAIDRNNRRTIPL